MKDRLQAQLQAQVSAHLPGFRVECKYTSHHRIDILLFAPKTKEAMRITGITVQSLLGAGALDEVVEQLLFEILNATQIKAERRPRANGSD